MDASWQPDPTGRHQYRWWDGVAWTDHVADHGEQAADPMPARPSPRVTVSTTPDLGPTNPTPSGGYATAPIRRRRVPGALLAIGAVVVLAVGLVVFLVVGRDTSDPARPQAGETLGQLTEEGDYVVRDVKMRAGEAIRFRVEGAENRDLVTYLIAEDDVASDYADAYFTDFGSDLGLSDIEATLDDLVAADDVLTDATMEDDMVGYVVMKDSDRCCAGVPDADSFLAVAAGTYRIVVIEADGRDSAVRILVEEYDGRISEYEQLTDALETDPFFTDTAFFEDSEPYEPDAGS